MNEPSRNKALTKALDLLNKRSYSKEILTQKLREKEFPAQEIDLAIKRLEFLGFLNDKKYAENLVREYSQFKRYGSYRVKLKLKEKKVPEQVIKDALDQISLEIEQENIKELARKYLNNKNLPKEKLYNRALGYLIRRGYSFQQSRKAVLEELNRGD